MEQPKKEQVTEWFESPTTDYFFSLLAKRNNLVKYELMQQGFDVEHSEVLQGLRGNLWGLRTVYEDLERLFESQSFSEMEEEGDGEPIWDLPSR